METLLVHGRTRLAGEIQAVGSKNAALMQMAASLLADGTSSLSNVPPISDIAVMAGALRQVGSTVALSGDTVTVSPSADPNPTVAYDSVRRLRNAFLLLGPLLARCGHARVAHPGSDIIGSRGLDMHMTGLTHMGASISVERGFVVAQASRLTGASIALDFPSVGTTGNLIMAAVLALGHTEIENAARDPEIVDLCRFLTSMGAQIEGAGTYQIIIDGVDELKPTAHWVLGDRAIAGTWAIAAVMTRGDITVRGVTPADLHIVLDKLSAAQASIDIFDDGFRAWIADRPKALDITTLPAPGFASDLLPMAFGLASVSDGLSMITENVFDGRFMFIDELSRLGAHIRTDGHHAVIRGRERLSSAPVHATDIRAGAALVFAALCADSVTEVSGAERIDRGYPDFVSSLRALGASVDLQPVAE